jgi:DoxX-like family
MGVAVLTAYVIVAVLTALALTLSAGATLIRHEKVLENMDRAGVPRSWLTMLGTLKALGALGILVGLGVPLIGAAAAIGVILFFVGAFITHLRARWYSFGFPGVFFLLAVGSLVLRVASWPASA